MNIETNPSAQMPFGNLRYKPLLELIDSGLLCCNEVMSAVFYAAQQSLYRDPASQYDTGGTFAAIF